MNRLCAAARRTGSCAFVLIGFSLALFAFCVPTVVAEESGDQEVSIGTFTLSSPEAESGRGVPGPLPSDFSGMRPEATKAPAASAIPKAQELFDDAVAALNGGRSEEAQRLFELLIGEAPDGALAREARGHLAELYRSAPRNSAVASRTQSTGSRDGDVVQPRALAESPKLGGSTAPAGRERGRGSEVSAALEEQFITEAGDRVFFSAGSAELGTRARGVLQAQARFIKLRPDLAATIEGHADDAPLSAEEHARLSEARAEAVRQRLIEEGIESSRLAVSSWGRDKRVSDCAEPACAAQNRRAVTVLVSARARRTEGPSGALPGGASVAAREPALLTH